jgi:single-strand DNA-binding protein
MNLNKAMIIGNLTRDPEARTTPQGATVASFSIATNFVWTDANGQRQEKVEYHNIVAWRKLADICTQYLKKGSKVYLEGRMQTRDWEGQDGVKRYRTEIVAENMIMLDRPTGSTTNSFSDAKKTSSQPETSLPVNDDQGNEASADDEIKIENIPF